MKDAVLYTGAATLMTHELDAMTNGEWRVLPLVRALPDETGMIVFVVLHIPIFAVIIGCLASANEAVRQRTRTIIAAFLLIHAGLHTAFMAHPAYEFETTLSNALIFGGAILGGLYFFLERQARAA